MSYSALTKYIGRIHEVRYFMPPFVGTEVEAKALAAYIAGRIHDKDIVDREPASDDPMARGNALFDEYCSACHALDEVTGAFEGMEQDEVGSMLMTLNEISEEMEPFSGTDEERTVLAEFLRAAAAGEDLAPAVDGKVVFEDNCSACHAADDFVDSFGGVEQGDILTTLSTLDEISEEMVPFDGTEAEAKALADFLNGLKGGE